jgi:plastocyanin
MSRSLAVCLAFGLGGCLASFQPGEPPPQEQDPGGGGGGGGGIDPGGGGGGAPDAGSGATFDLAGPPSPVGTLDVALANSGTQTQKIRLNEARDLDVLVTPGNGFSGMVMFSAAGLPPGVTATFTPPGAMMATPMSTTLTISVASDFMPQSNMPVTITATSGAISGQTALTLNVPAELLVVIPKNVNIGTSTNPNRSAFGAPSIPVYQVAPGTKVTFLNADSINHEVHSDGTLGIQHEGGPLQANGANTYTQTFNGTGTFDFNCHIHPSMKGQIVVK